MVLEKCGLSVERSAGHYRVLSRCRRFMGKPADRNSHFCPPLVGHAYDNARFVSNNGRSLPMVADSSMDLAFSFDSLVHIEADVLAA